uniref:Uncharacterized protein n=1 Tax=Nothobranchius furzeri TaxID=105023 RepID=A0A8C6KQ36_NOTFU
MGSSANPVTDSQDPKMYSCKDAALSLPTHSYWFDLWVFVVFDIVLFFFVYFIIP